MLADIAEQISQQQHHGGGAPAGVIVKTMATTDLAAVEARMGEVLPKVGMGVRPLVSAPEGNLARLFEVTLPTAGDLAADGRLFDLVYALEAQRDIAGVEPKIAVPTAPDWAFPGDNPASGHDAVDQDESEWHLRDVNAFGAWEFSRSRSRPPQGEGIGIAVIDTGRTDHLSLTGAIDVDLSANMLEGNDDLRDKYAMTDAPRPPLGFLINPGHGTATMGVAAARLAATDAKVRGVAPLATIACYRATDGVLIGGDNQRAICDSIMSAAAEACRVISMSLGTPFWSMSITDAIDYATERGCVPVAAAGNRLLFPWSPNDDVVFPANSEKCIGVSGSTRARLPYNWSCFGEATAIAAPAENVWVAWKGGPSEPKDHVGESSGTSYATAIVSGIAALWWAHRGEQRVYERYGDRTWAGFKSELQRSCAIWEQGRKGPGIASADQLIRELFHSPAPADADLGRVPDESPVARPALAALRGRGVREEALARLEEPFLHQFGLELHYLSVLNAPGGTTVSGVATPTRPEGVAMRPSARLARECDPEILAAIAPVG